jgi:hypothetical protein
MASFKPYQARGASTPGPVPAAGTARVPWDETEEDVWAHTQAAVRASGGSLTVFVKGHHPFAMQGGATLFDDVRVVDEGD